MSGGGGGGGKEVLLNFQLIKKLMRSWVTQPNLHDICSKLINDYEYPSKSAVFVFV